MPVQRSAPLPLACGQRFAASPGVERPFRQPLQRSAQSWDVRRFPAACAALGATCARCPRGNRRCSSTNIVARRAENTDSAEMGFLNKTTAPLILVVLAILYGGNVPLLKTVEMEAPLQLTGPELLALRFVSSTVVSLPFLATNWRKVGALLVPSTELAIWLFAGYALQILGLEKTSASTCAVASALTGPFVQILELVVDGKQFSPFVALCSAGTFAGIALFVSAPSLAEESLFERFWNILKMIAPQGGPLSHEAILKGVPGEALAITGAFLFAVHVYRSNRLIEEGDPTGRVSGTDFAVGLAAVQLAAAAVICIVASAIDSPYSTAEQLRIAGRLQPRIWEEILVCGVLCTGLPAVVELFAFNYVGPAVASLIYCTIPLWGTFLSVIFLNEKLGLQAITAAAIILLCSFAPSLRELATESEE